jgi:hypothetical protein
MEKKKGERKKDGDVVFAGDLSIRICENFTIDSVYHALSNGVIFINSARDQKF